MIPTEEIKRKTWKNFPREDDFTISQPRKSRHIIGIANIEIINTISPALSASSCKPNANRPAIVNSRKIKLSTQARVTQINRALIEIFLRKLSGEFMLIP
jgi:hypothetical protein